MLRLRCYNFLVGVVRFVTILGRPWFRIVLAATGGRKTFNVGFIVEIRPLKGYWSTNYFD